MRYFENERGTSKRRRKNRAYLQKKKESATIAAKKDISPESADYLKLITRKSIILRRNEDERLKKSLN
jgi:hypothetical protein